MARPASRHPTDLELDILKVLWRDCPRPGGARNVRHVVEALRPARKLAYTSVMTVMNIMVDKNYLRRRKEGPTFVYTPRVTEQATSRRMLRDLVDRAFAGSPLAVVQQLLDVRDLDPNELEQLRTLVNDMAKNSGNNGLQP